MGRVRNEVDVTLTAGKGIAHLVQYGILMCCFGRMVLPKYVAMFVPISRDLFLLEHLICTVSEWLKCTASQLKTN